MCHQTLQQSPGDAVDQSASLWGRQWHFWNKACIRSFINNHRHHDHVVVAIWLASPRSAQHFTHFSLAKAALVAARWHGLQILACTECICFKLLNGKAVVCVSFTSWFHQSAREYTTYPAARVWNSSRAKWALDSDSISHSAGASLLVLKKVLSARVSSLVNWVDL